MSTQEEVEACISAFRYGYPPAEVTRAIGVLNHALGTQRAPLYTADRVKPGGQINAIFSAEYKATVEALAGRILEAARIRRSLG